MDRVGNDRTTGTVTCYVLLIPCIGRKVSGLEARHRVAELIVDCSIDDGGGNLGGPPVNFNEGVAYRAQMSQLHEREDKVKRTPEDWPADSIFKQVHHYMAHTEVVLVMDLMRRK
ncbi:hypothetical protein K443DRAFT_412967 [Laccaria amethystina LaAM-08-1]|uniref:Uncharacterized protein n=1 Tax=Laccaria amethystina LaAM-08-1 TaxID=1095629 RepID=A0A0C9WQ06_9AGAR|nr:hypothetical protein K443DRAFT_412967 [Laccaria amethystina LaAM-08-1]